MARFNGQRSRPEPVPRSHLAHCRTAYGHEQRYAARVRELGTEAAALLASIESHLKPWPPPEIVRLALPSIQEVER